MLQNLNPRLYQQTILATCAEKNSLVVLPTGMGKSIIFVMLIAQRLKQYPKSKAMILVPTKPLAEQHVKTIEQFLDVSVALFTGAIKAEKRAEMFAETQVIVSTPQGLENDVVAGRISFKDVSLLVFDECHRATGDYSYVWLAKHYMQHANYTRILGLTASPGSDLEGIKEVCHNLFVEAIEVRTKDDPDVKPYIQEVETTFVEVALDDRFRKVLEHLNLLIKDRYNQLLTLGTVKQKKPLLSRRDVLSLQAELRTQLSQGDKSFDILKSLSIAAEIMKVQHAVELVETQGLHALKKYFDKMINDSVKTSTKAVKRIVADIHFRSAKILTDSMIEEGIEHPKFAALLDLVRTHKEGKIIVFNQYRDNAAKIVSALNEIEGVSAQLFVGQAKKNGTGLSQKEQKEMIEAFSNEEFNVIVMTSVGEEGLDIPSVGLVVFFEPVPSAIRSIQRSGRTGRLEGGKVLVLVAKGTRDEAHRWSAHHKERKMYDVLSNLKKSVGFIKEAQEQQTLMDVVSEKVIIHVDHREKASKAIKVLLEKGVKIELAQLEVADYILSEDVGVELKNIQDFVNSIVDGRLLGQIKDLKYNFKRPILILEGDEDIFSVRNIHPNSIRGMLATIAVDFGIAIIPTRNYKETAEMLYAIAKREQTERTHSFSPNPTKRGISLEEQQVHFVGGLPEIGEKLAKELLDVFGSPSNIVNASVDELKTVEKIGTIKAKKLRELFDHSQLKEK